MDINRLLTPNESSEKESGPAPPTTSPRKQHPFRPTSGTRTASGLSQEITRSPERHASRSNHPGYGMPTISEQTTSAPRHQTPVAAPNFRPLQASPPANPYEVQNSFGYVPAVQPQQRPIIPHRNSSAMSTPQMDTLADLATRQQRQSFRRSDSSSSVPQTFAEMRQSPSLINPNNTAPPPITRAISTQSLADITMAEAPKETPPPRTFTSTALSETEAQTVNDLLSYLGENSYAYDSHVQLVNLLHKGLMAHVYPPEDSNSAPRDPHQYGLLVDLRQAREAMDTRFAMGEPLLLDFLSDEMMLAKSADERVSVTELCQKAVQDEPASTKLWQLYVNWFESNYAVCHDFEGADQTGWTTEDKEVCKELFTKDMLMNILEQATAATQWRIDESHLLWNRYIELAQQDMAQPTSTADFERLQNLFMQRLQIPHGAWDDTAQLFWPLVSKFHGGEWEAVMSQVNEMASQAKIQMGIRDEHEMKLQRAIDSGDNDAILGGFTRYLKWEKLHRQRAAFDKELRCAMYERALLRFPTYTEWWLDYIDFVVSQKPSSHDPSSSVLPLIERATRHCPWSGDLWARRILRSDVERKSYHDIESIKHRATNSGLLDVGGMEEMLKVSVEWCSYLRRNAFTATSSEDDLDTAEVGITMALEDVQQAGHKVYGDSFQGDPLYRLERIQIKFFAEARRFEDARNIWRNLMPKHKDSYEFWSRYYQWELMLWGHHRLSDGHRVETTENAPHLASAVMEEALKQKNLDWPEQVLELYTTHFQHHESVEKLQIAAAEAREFSRRLAIKRAKEAEAAAEAAAQQQQQQQQQVAELPDSTTAITGEKRRRDEETLVDGDASKKSKTQNVPASVAGFGEPSGSATAQAKRDRENSTITVTNLPGDATENELKKFFRDCGTIRSMNIIKDENADTATATVEFELPEDVLTAKTRNGKELKGYELHIRSGTQSTLYVANYPAEYSEKEVRQLFEAYGEIVSVRFPSLKFNVRRRFCYVQFFTAEEAKAAEKAMDGTALDGLHTLVAKVSNPDAKKQRSGAAAEGRELFVKNLENSVPDDQVKAFFEQFGKVISMNLVKAVGGRRLGSAFLVMSSTDEASKAVDQANNKPFHNRVLHVSIASAKGGAAPLDKARKTDFIIKQSASPEPSAEGGRRGSDTSMADAHDDSWKTARERKVAIFNLPETVNDARITSEMEKHGRVVKLQIRRDQSGAIVEFADLKVAFDVRQGVECSALGPNVKTGEVDDLLKSKAKKAAAAAASLTPAAGFGGMRPSTIARPTQRGGRRGGLGFKRGGASGVGSGQSGQGQSVEAPKQNGAGPAKNGAGPAKSNADFKSMFEKSREAGKEEE